MASPGTAEAAARELGPALARASPAAGGAAADGSTPAAPARRPRRVDLAASIARGASPMRSIGREDEPAARRADRYGTSLSGRSNIVIFQFNPESLARTLQIPPRPTGATQRETTQAGEKTFESITFKAHFSAANMLDEDKALAKLFGIGPQLAALEKMVLPSSKIAGLIGAAIDAIGDALGGGGADTPDHPIPREVSASCSSGAHPGAAAPSTR
jgi:hypothetical protein